MIHITKTEWVEGMTFEAEVPGGRLQFDADAEFGGEGKGVRPKATLLSALAGCTGMDVISLLNKMRVDITGFRIEVDGNLTEAHPKIYDQITVRYYFKGPDIKQDKIEKAVDLSVTRYCGVFEMFRSFAKITTEIIYE